MFGSPRRIGTSCMFTPVHTNRCQDVPHPTLHQWRSAVAARSRVFPYPAPTDHNNCVLAAPGNNLPMLFNPVLTALKFWHAPRNG